MTHHLLQRQSFCLIHCLNPQQAKKCLATNRMPNSLLNWLTYYWTTGFWFSSVRSSEICKIKKESGRNKNGSSSDLPPPLLKFLWPIRTSICFKVNSVLPIRQCYTWFLFLNFNTEGKPFLHMLTAVLLLSVLLPSAFVNHKMLEALKFKNKKTNTIKQNFHQWFQPFC